MFSRKLRELYGKHQNSPIVEVTEEEFLQRWVKAGGTEEEGKSQLRISKTLGSSVGIGESKYRVK